MFQIKKDQGVFIRKGAKLLVGTAPETVTTTGPRAGKIVEQPLVRYLGSADVTVGGKVVKVGVNRVIAKGKIAALNGDSLTVLPTSELVTYSQPAPE